MLAPSTRGDESCKAPYAHASPRQRTQPLTTDPLEVGTLQGQAICVSSSWETSLISKATGLSSPNRMTDFSRNVTGISSCLQPVDSSSAVSMWANTSSATSFLIWKKTLLGRLSQAINPYPFSLLKLI